MDQRVILSFRNEFPSLQVWVRYRNLSPEIIPLVTQSRLLDKATCVGASIGLGPYNVRILLHVARNLELLAQFVFLFSVKIFKSKPFCVCTYLPLFIGTLSFWVFTSAHPILSVLKSRVRVSRKIRFGTPYPGFFQIIEVRHLWQHLQKCWLSRCGRKHVQEQDSHQSATNRKEQDRERKMCELVIVESGLRQGRARKGCVKKNNEVKWVS